MPFLGPSDILDDVAKRIEAMSPSDLARFDTLGLQIANQFDRIAKEVSVQFAHIETELA